MNQILKNNFTAKQIEIITYDLKNKPIITILEGAIRSGKTIANIILFLNHIEHFRYRKLSFVISGTSIASIKRNVLDEIQRLFDIPTILNQKNEFEIFGNKIICFGADQADSYKVMKGFTAYGWLANEITNHHINSVDQLLKRCSGKDARLFWDTNPENPTHFIKTNFIDKDGETLKNGKERIKSWHFILDDNTFLQPQYIEAIKASTPQGMWYDRDILGLWVAAEGMIYKDFDYSKHVIVRCTQQIKQYWCAIDWGFSHLGVLTLFGEDHDGNVYQLEEIAESNKSIDFWVSNAIRYKMLYGNIPIYCDPARPDNIDKFKSSGLYVLEANNSVVEGITFVATLFKNKKYFIVRDSNKNFLKEIYGYRWRDKTSKEEPIKEKDDSMDATRYGLYSHLGAKRVVTATKNIWG